MPSTTFDQSNPAALSVRPTRASSFHGLRLGVALVVGGVAEHAGDVEPVADLDGAAQHRAGLAGRAVGGRRGERLLRAAATAVSVISTWYCGPVSGDDHGGARRRILREVGLVDLVHLLELRPVGDEDAATTRRCSKRHAGGLQDLAGVVEHGLRLRRSCRLRPTVLSLPLRDDQAREEQRVAGLDAVAVRIGRRRSSSAGWMTTRSPPVGTATIAISTSAPGMTRSATIVVRAGGSFGQNVRYTSFIAAKSSARS